MKFDRAPYAKEKVRLLEKLINHLGVADARAWAGIVNHRS